MKQWFRRMLRPALFTAAGALAGFGWYALVGCPTGSCPITANPFTSMAWFGGMGWLLSGILEKENDSCNT